MDNQKIEADSLTRTSFLANTVHDKYQTARTQRVLQEQVWIEAMQNFNGEYGPAMTFRDGGSSVFVNITQMKTMAAYSRVMAVMMGPAGYPWSAKPTPHPTLVKMGMSPEAAKVSSELDPQFKKELSEARSKCDGMKNRIKDDLVESCWEERFARGVLDLVSMGTAIFKGPFAAPSKPKKWVQAPETVQSMMDRAKALIGLGKPTPPKFVLAKDPMDEYRATMDWVSPFELYPDPGAYSIEDAMWTVHRHVMNKAQLVELADGAGFDAEEIQATLDQNPDGNWYSEPWEGFMDIINRRSQAAYLSKRYTVLEFWGWLSGRELRDAGAEIGDNDLHKMHMSNVWVCGNQCIKVAISGNEAKRLPYFVVPYEKVPYKIWGRGVPEKMADPQAIINASARAMVENMGMAAGPQVIYDVNRVMPGTKVDQIVPWGIWAVKNMEGISEPPVRFVKIDPILTELKTIQDIFRNFVQEVTSMPDMASGFSGNEQHNRTMGGMSMLFGAADSYTRSVIFNIDNYLTKPMIRALYDWEMQYCPDASIKGDITIEASGVQGLMAKELTSQRLAELLQAVGQIPGGADYINMPELMKEVFRSLEVINDSVILSDTEVKQKREETQQAAIAQASQTAQVQNLAKPKAETTKNDMLMQVLEKTLPTDPIYAPIYAKWLRGINELDPQSEAALNIMKMRATIENKAYADQQELAIMQQDLEMSDKIRAQMGQDAPKGNVPAPQPSAVAPSPQLPVSPSSLMPPMPGGVM